MNQLLISHWLRMSSGLDPAVLFPEVHPQAAHFVVTVLYTLS